MVSNETGREHALRAVWVPTISPLSSDELKERLASLLDMQGDTLESFEKKLRVQGRTWQSMGMNHDDSSTTPPGARSSPTTSPISPTETSPGCATTTTEVDGSDSESAPDMKADAPKQAPSLTADVAAGFPTSAGDLIIGEEAPKDIEFCPWKMAQNYPDWFVGKANTPRVSFSSSGFCPSVEARLKC